MSRVVIVVMTLGVVANVVPKAVADESQQQVAYYSCFVGEWKVTLEGSQTEGTFLVKVGPSERCHMTWFTFGDQTSEGIYGCDPSSGRWTGVGFNADGTRWSEVFAKPQGPKLKPGDSFASDNEEVTVDKAKTTHVSQIRIVDDHTFTAESPQKKWKFVRK